MKTLILPLFIAAIFFSVGCSKDKRIEKNLKKGDGKWNIETISWTKTHQDLSSGNQSVTTGVETNAGTFTFNDGTVKVDYVLDGENKTGTYADFAVEDQEISIVHVEQDIFSSNWSQTSVTYTGTQENKTHVIIDGSETVQNSNEQTVIVATFDLKK